VAARAWLRRSAVLLGVLTAAGVAFEGVNVRRAQRAAHLDRDAEAPLASLLTECRWERPVVGGPARDCNGAQEADAAAFGLFTGTKYREVPGARLPEVLERDGAPPPFAAALLASHAPQLADLREATRCSWACVRDLGKSTWAKGTVQDGAALLLFAARAADPAVCAAMARDALRLVEDGAAGLEGPIVYARSGDSAFEQRLVREVRRTWMLCLARGDAEVASGAARDAAVLAAPSPVGDAMALAALEDAAALVATVRGDHGGLPWYQRGTFLDAAEDLLAIVPALRTYHDDDLPTAFDRVERERLAPHRALLGDRLGSWGYRPNEVLEGVVETPAKILRQRALLDRDLRLTAVALAAIRDHLAHGAWPAAGPTEIALPALRDPFTGEPFRWTVDAAGPVLVAPAARGEGADSLALP
jgi:hypothetical protein